MNQTEGIETKRKKKRRRRKKLFAVLLCILVIAIFGAVYYFINRAKHPRMTFIGHATIKIISKEGTVIYIDPYYPIGDYKEPADYILITHGHNDHNDISKCKQAEGCRIIRWRDALVDGEYQVFEKDEVRIEAVPSGGNGNHNPRICVGYIVTVDGVSVYHAGDTVMHDALKSIVGKKIDYALYTVNGRYTMGPEEATEVADMIGARVNIPIHGDGKKFSKQAKEFHAKGKKRLFIGQMIFLR